ncbi:hypothetical protein [Cylindrospermopsis raciborskii]|jgi:hypothetical protein|uniref:hypothetical protein n=1 Tax=Cylindrospermopsis raciborskii TaxID=77022 RepID=UPI001F3B5E17|nr:hypothetical protein [Cylindrospermopsis raciborskii]UJS04096.1 hypothetical protein L3I90_13465 [Cylindrospermopsis raciborskii KLL07]
MQVIEKNSLFAQVSGEQSAVVSGGAVEEFYNAAAYAIVAAFLGVDPDLIKFQTVNILFGPLV